MANFETSFIPEQGATYQGGSRRSIVATVFSIIIAIIAVGLSGYSWWMQRQEEAKVKKLEAEIVSMESRFDIDKIAMLGRLDKRINLAKDMFSKHPMPSLIIDYITDNTISTVKWKSISYTRATAEEGSGDTVELSGEGVGYSALVQQLNQFRTKATEISKVDLKSYRIDPRTNTVSIQMTLSIKPTFATFDTVRQKNITATGQDVITNEVVQPIVPTPAPAPTPAIIQPKAPVVNPAQAQVILTPTQGTSSKPQSATSTN
jgi:hypothetical protein